MGVDPVLERARIPPFKEIEIDLRYVFGGA
jgi:hypothetical protein